MEIDPNKESHAIRKEDLDAALIDKIHESTKMVKFRLSIEGTDNWLSYSKPANKLTREETALYIYNH